MRKLVTVRTISEIRPISGADKIELALIDGWQCVVKKGEFKIGDKGLYFEIDSFLPLSDSRFNFLEPRGVNWRGQFGARIKTMKLRGELSQGLLLPLTEFPEVKGHVFGWEKDYAQELNVKKWERDGETEKVEKQANWLGRKLKKLKHTKLKPLVKWLETTFPNLLLSNSTRPFPSFIPKTDEERVQNLINKLDRDPDKMWLSTVKVDGSSMTAYFNRKKFGVCSRNLDLKKDRDNKFWQTAMNYNLDKAMKALGLNIAIQGELLGPGIQGNREKLKEYKFFMFKIWDIDAKRYLPITERGIIAAQLRAYGAAVDAVPLVNIHCGLDEFKTIDDFLAYAEGPSLSAGVTREGVVFEDYYTGEKGFKVIANSYLLEKDK